MKESESSLLELESASGETRTFPLHRKQVLIGRSPNSDLFLVDSAVSRLHARLESPDKGSWRVVDLDSKNGTFVNGSRRRMAILLEGDVIQIGDCRMTLHLTEDLDEDELELALPDTPTQTVFVDSGGIPADHSEPAQRLADLHDALGKMTRIETSDAMLREAAELFRGVLRADRVATGPCKGRLAFNNYQKVDFEENTLLATAMEKSTVKEFQDRGNKTVAQAGLSGTKPAVFFRANKYDPRRAHVAVYNPAAKDAAGTATVRVDAGAVLKDGQKFRLMNPRDLWGKASLTGVARNGTIDVLVKGELAVYVLLAD